MNINLLVRFGVIFLVVSGNCCVWAATNVISDTDLLQKKNEQRAIDNMLSEQQQRNQARKNSSLTLLSEPARNAQSWFVRTIYVDQQGETLGPGVDQILAHYQQRKLSKNDLLLLVRDVTNSYIEKGFSTTLMSLDFSQLHNGTLRINVLWGRVASVTINGKEPTGWRDRLFVQSALPGVVGKILNLNDIDQAVDNLNNGMLTASVQVQPAEQPGYSILAVTTANKVLSASLSTENSGAGDDRAGRWKNTVSFAINGPLGNGDIFSLSASQNYYQDAGNNHYRTLGAGWSVPWGRWTLALSGSSSNTLQAIPGTIRVYTSNGRSVDLTGTLSNVLSRSGKQKTTAQIAVNYKSYDNYFEHQKIQVSSRDYSELRLGINRVQSLGPGTLYGDLSMNYGVPWFHAQPGLDNGSGSQRSRRLTGNLSWAQTLDAGRPLNWTSRLGWQYSPDSLPSGTKFRIGDEYTVKGFSSSASASASSGLWVATSVSSTWQPLSWFYLAPFTGLEYGLVRDRSNSQVSAALSSISAGLRLSSGPFNSSLTFGYPLSDSRKIKESEPVIWFNATLRY